jgi:hypothetical protein
MVAPTFTYSYVPVNDLHVEMEEDPNTGKPKVKHVLVQDEPIQASQRFWTSLFSRYGFNKSFFNYFDHAEVFDRISMVEANDRMRICIERGQDATGKPVNRLMAVSNPLKPLVVYDELMDTLRRYGGDSVNYNNGIVESTHLPSTGGNRFDILGDIHENRFVMQTPIDGYGAPNIYLALLRQICSNGVVGLAKAFRCQLGIGKGADDVTPTLIRALDGFNNDDGYAALRQRLTSAGSSWLSVYESQQLYKLLIKLHSELLIKQGVAPRAVNISQHLEDSQLLGAEHVAAGPVIRSFHKMTGDPSEAYGLANLDSLSAKRQRTLPVACKVYDAIVFATEVATHYAEAAGSRKLQAWVGTMVSDEYDMENTVDAFPDFASFLIETKTEAGTTGSEYSASTLAVA